MNRDRASRNAAKEVPSRASSRLYSARKDAQDGIEAIRIRVRQAGPPAEQAEIIAEGLRRLELSLREAAPGTPRATSAIRALSRDIARLSIAVDWLISAWRVSGKLTDPTSRKGLEQVAAWVLDCVQDQDLDGTLTAATADLKQAVAEAENEVAHAR